MQQRIEADEIRQRQGSDGMIAAQHHALVDILGSSQPFIQHVESFIEHQTEDAVDDKRRSFLHDDNFLADFLAPLFGNGQRLVGRLITADDFQKFHDRNRIEEMRADHLGGTLGHRGHLRDAQSRRVREEKAMRRNNGFKFFVYLFLNRHQFNNHFDHDIRAGCRFL